MLNFNSIRETEKMYEVRIGEHIWRAKEADVQQVIDFLNRVGTHRVVQSNKSESQVISNTSKSDVLHLPEEKSSNPTKMVGEKVWQEDFLTVVNDGGAYRIYIHCPIGGKKGKGIRYAIKMSATTEYGAVFTGDHDNKVYHWTFPNEDKAKAFIQSRKDYAESKGE